MSTPASSLAMANRRSATSAADAVSHIAKPAEKIEPTLPERVNLSVPKFNVLAEEYPTDADMRPYTNRKTRSFGA